MTKEIISSEIRDLVEVIREQQELVLTYREAIPQIEMDILMANIRKLYERLMELNKINQSAPKVITAPPPVSIPTHTDELIAHIATAEKIMAGLPDVTDEIPVSATTPEIFIAEQEISIVAEKADEQVTVPAVVAEEIIIETVPEIMEVKVQTNVPEHMQSESLISDVETKVVASQNEITEQAVLPQAALAKERTREFTRPQSKSTSMASLFDDAPSIANTFQGTKSVHDKISAEREDKSLAEKMQKNPVSDLKKSIGINEKFAFINELFDGDLNSYNQAIDMLNSSAGYSDAVSILEKELSGKYNWNGESDSYLRLKNLIDRRFGA